MPTNNVQIQSPASKLRNPNVDQTVCCSESHDVSSELIDRCYDKACLLGSTSWHWKTLPLPLHVLTGPVTARRGDKLTFKKAAGQTLSTLGYGCALTCVLHRFCPYRLELMVYLVVNWNGLSLNASLHWDLSPLRIVPYGTDAFVQVARGDIDALKMTLGKRASTVYDVTPNGCTLLHVR